MVYMEFTRKQIILVTLKSIVVIAFIGEFILLTEVGLRTLAFRYYGNSYYLWPPFFSRVSTPDSGVFPGIEGKKRFFVNSLGMRGDELQPTHTRRILTIGGSTTECGMLDEEETWPYQLQTKLRTVEGESVWVGNAGRRGSTSRDHIWHMKYFLPQIEKVDVLLLLIGVNDFMLHLYESYEPQIIDDVREANTDELSHAFFIHPNTKYGVKGSALWSLLKQVKVSLFGRKKILDTEGRTQLEWQKKRVNTQPKINELPTIELGLSEYRHNLKLIAKMANNQRLRVILLTQPSLWQATLSSLEEQLLWFGCADNKTYTCYSSKALEEGLEKYNQIVREVCESDELECVDLSSILPKETTVFYDDVHFNPSGAEKVASVIFNYLTKSAIPGVD